MVEKRDDSFLRYSVNKCTLEDIGLTYSKLKELGSEELKNRLSTLHEIQKFVDDMNSVMTRETKTLAHDNSRKKFDLNEKRVGSEVLSLPRLLPTICTVDTIAGYKDVVSNDEKLKTHPEVRQKIYGESRKKHSRTLPRNSKRKLCINCKMETMNQNFWLPKLVDTKAVRKTSSGSADKDNTVLPAINNTKYS